MNTRLTTGDSLGEIRKVFVVTMTVNYNHIGMSYSGMACIPNDGLFPHNLSSFSRQKPHEFRQNYHQLLGEYSWLLSVNVWGCFTAFKVLYFPGNFYRYRTVYDSCDTSGTACL